MFCDLVDSTRIAAKLDAEEWRDLVGAYLDAASAAVTEMGGKVAKKLGDGLMALFGYPVAQENDAERAVRAALAIQRPGGDAAWVTRCGGACQAGEARALAAAARRLAAQPQAWAAGHADAIATLMRRTLTRTRAPILSSFRRMVPQVALANGV